MYIKLYETVIVTEGFSRTLICDTHSEKNSFVPNDFAKFITSIGDTKINNYLAQYDKVEAEIIKEYIEFIIANEYGFVCDTKNEFKLFPKKSLHFEVPFTITNCVIDISKSSNFNVQKLFEEIINLNIPFLQIRVAHNVSDSMLLKLIDFISVFNDSSLNELFLLLPYSIEIEVIVKSRVISEKYFTLLFYNANEPFKSTRVFNNVNINYTTQCIEIPMSCGTTKINNFIINDEFYREGLHFNNCLNLKISVDQNGEIKNCPSMLKSYGNIDTIKLADVLLQDGFKDMWAITKSSVFVCKDCEFRNICTDCRAYTQNPTDVYSKPLKCGYDPYTNVWEEWSVNPLNKKGIQYYNLQCFEKKIDV